MRYDEARKAWAATFTDREAWWDDELNAWIFEDGTQMLEITARHQGSAPRTAEFLIRDEDAPALGAFLLERSQGRRR